jgi:hypothetical protein
MAMNDAPLKRSLSGNAKREAWSERILLAGLFLEITLLLAFSKNDPWYETASLVFANILVFAGCLGEAIWGGAAKADAEELQRLSEERVSAANERAAKADLARVELETKLLPRELNQKQWDFIQTLKGQFEIIAIGYETDAETQFFASGIRDAFFAAGIAVAMYPRAPDVHSVGTFIFDPKGFQDGRARTAEPLVELFRKSDLLGSVAVINELPSDIIASIFETREEMRAPMDAPMIIVGGRFVIPPPHIERAQRAAKAAMDAMEKITGGAAGR